MKTLVASLIFLITVGFSNTALGYQAGFNLDIVGLSGERVTDVFGTPRDGCPHKGVDYSSSQRPKDFISGVYGKVVEPEESGWGTIAIIPFHASDYTVQYLHSSAKYVTVGDIVQPWTVIGATGDTAPPGTGITGIHLHLQVQAMRAASSQPCWNGREFVNPETWNITNPLVGTWRSIATNVVKGVMIENISTIQFSADTTGASVTGEARKLAQFVSPQTGKLYKYDGHFRWSGRVAGRQKHTLEIEMFPGTCTQTVDGAPAPWTCVAKASRFDVQLQSSNALMSISLADGHKEIHFRLGTTNPVSSSAIENALLKTQKAITREPSSVMTNEAFSDTRVSDVVEPFLRSVRYADRALARANVTQGNKRRLSRRNSARARRSTKTNVH